MISVAMTDVGQIRKENQDSIFCSNDSVGILPNLYIVADGMGGHRAGEIASSSAIDAFVKNVKETELKEIFSVLEESVLAANAYILELSNEQKAYEGMGTTMVVLVVCENRAYIANVGDSRMYLIRDEIRQITKDHSLVQEMVVSGELDYESARRHKNKNVITKAVGAEEKVVADYFTIEINNEDILMLCSDGLTNMLEDVEIFSYIKNGETFEETAENLISVANQKGGTDNISVLLVRK